MTIGSSEPRIDGPAKVTGRADYPSDLRRGGANCLFAKIVFSGKPHARMRELNTAKARRMPGVLAIFTAADVPVNAVGLVVRDQAVLVGPGGSRGVPEPTVSRWEGDRIAIVVAETEHQACLAAQRIEVDWEDGPLVTTLEEAQKDETLIHPEHRAGSNTFLRVPIRKGDEPNWDTFDAVVSGTYLLAHQEHAYLQPEAALAYVEETGRVTVEVAGQWAHDDQRQIAAALDLPLDQVRVRYPTIGGAFGGREDVSVQIVMALAAWRLSQRGENRPIRTVWSREESILGHHKSHRMRIQARWGAHRDGRLAAVEAKVALDAGAYSTTSEALLRNALTTIAGPYAVPRIRVDGIAVFTHSVPAGAFRGFGAPQACFAAEMQMTRLANELGLDPVDLRRRNALRPGDEDLHQTPIPSGFGLVDMLDACSSRPQTAAIEPQRQGGFRSLGADPGALRRGRGFACGFKNVGYSFGSPEGCKARIELRGNDHVETVVVHCAAAEVGQGAHTVLVQIAADAVGVTASQVELITTDTSEVGDSGSASASRLTFMAGHAVRQAAAKARETWARGERPACGSAHFRAEPTEPMDPISGKGRAHVTFGAIVERVELVVDIETGRLEVTRVTCAHDAGRILNPDLVRGQIEGGIVQALGGAVFEELKLRDGRILNPRLSEYLIPGIADVPIEVESIAVETEDPAGPAGARGIGEMPFIPLAAAIAAALHDATGVYFDELPFTPERILGGLRDHGL